MIHENGARPESTTAFVLVEELGRALIVILRQLAPVRQFAVIINHSPGLSLTNIS